MVVSYPPFIKAIPPGSYGFGCPVMSRIKLANNSLRGNDRQAFIKSAGHHFADLVKNAEWLPGDVPVHQIIMGCTEKFGVNRNFDGFKRAALRQYHDTFVKLARCYRNHANKRPDRSYGYIKYSWYNPQMDRVELVAVYNGTKEAAARNSGLVADLELQALEKDGDFPVSMATRLPWDQCSSCQHRARNRSEYCRGLDEGGQCKDGGLRNRIGKYTGDPAAPLLHADNTFDLVFFDSSMVPRGADRTAHALGLLKAADFTKMGGAELAEALGIGLPLAFLAEDDVSGMVHIAAKLAAWEDELEKTAADRWVMSMTPAEAGDFDLPLGCKLGDALRALANYKIALPVEQFLRVVGGASEKLAAAASMARGYLPGIYNRLLDSGEIVPLIEEHTFTPREPAATLTARDWAEKRAAQWSLADEHANNRLLAGALRKRAASLDHGRVKWASDGAETIAKNYAVYKVQALHQMLQDKRVNPELLFHLAALQNYVA